MSEVLDRLMAVIEERKNAPGEASYTASLMAGGDLILKKVVEEALETVLAAKVESRERVTAEAGDLVYHLFVLLAMKGITLKDLEDELDKRAGKSGFERKRERTDSGV